MHKEDDEIKLEEHLREMLLPRRKSPGNFLSAKMPSTCPILSPIRMANCGKYGMIR